MMEQQMNICKGKTMLKRASEINEEINALIEDDKIRKEAENNKKLESKINDLSILLEESKEKRQRYAIDYEKILFAYPETKKYLEALGYTMVYMNEKSKYYIAFDEATAKELEKRDKKYLHIKLFLKIITLSMWAFFVWSIIIKSNAVMGWAMLVVISSIAFMTF